MSALGAVMEGSLEFMADHVDQLLPLVFNALQDPQPVVVCAALIALSQITNELGDDVVQKHHSTMIPVVFDLLGSRDPKIMKAACNTLDSLLEWVPQDFIVGYLPKLMEALLFIMTTHVDSDVKIIVVSAIGAAAHSSKEAFFPYLDSTVKTLFSIQDLTSEENYDLRACVTDTLGTTASAVRKEKFLPYMDQSFQLALDGLKTESSRLRESAFCFFAGMADVLREGLNPVLDQIMPALFETLEQEDIDFGDKLTEEDAKALLNGDVTDDMSDDDDESIELKVNSALQLEKEIAADALREIFVNVKGAFLPYLATATTQLVELADTFYDGARKSALSALWAFVVTLGELQVTEPWVPGLPVVFHCSWGVLTIGCSVAG
jgi:importin-4